MTTIGIVHCLLVPSASPDRIRLRRRRWASGLAAALVVALAPAPSAGAQSHSPAARVQLATGRLTGAIHVDGRLDEPAWLGADSIGGLTQIEPVEGASPPGRTVIRVLADAGSIAIGIVCENPPGVPLVSYAKARDSELGLEDHIRLMVDTFQDGRTGYVFAVNPTGARYDALVANQGEGENSNWDGIWQSATTMTATGWVLEIRIPIRTLSFPAGADRWRFNVQRRIQSTQETDRWAGARRDWKLGQSEHAGELVGLPRFELGWGLAVRPAVRTVASVPAPSARVDGKVDLSADVTQRVGTDLTGSLTVNTDFAETEVDARRINLTRFPLFFPEKRTFFLEGADLFDFGTGSTEDIVPFFSRRIGLVGEEGFTAPLRVGAKLTGRIDRTRLGALITRMGAVPGISPRGTVGAVRLSQNVLRESSVGVIGTFGDPLGRSPSHLVGSDAVFRTSHFTGDKNLTLAAWGLATSRSDLRGDRSAVGVLVDYPNDLVDAFASWKRIGDGFDPSLGFVPRKGVQIYNLGATISPRPGQLGIRQMFIENFLTLYTDLAGRWESYRLFFAPVNWRLQSGDRIEANYVPQGERLTAPFAVADGISIAPGTYRFTRYRLEAEFANRRRLSGQLTWWFGGFYDGRLDQFIGQIFWRPSATLSLEWTGEKDIGRMPAGRFTSTLVGTRVRLNVSPELQVNSFVQYDTDSRSLGSNTRLRWTIRPVADLFVVYNHNLRRQLDRFSFDSNQLVAKFQYAFQF
jgi:hypothetical protein